MAELKVTHADFSLTSNWRVVTGSNGVKEITEGPSYTSKTVTFEYKLPAGAKVLRAYVHSVWGIPLSGFYTKKVNSTWVPEDTGNVDVELDPEATSLDVVFYFRAIGDTTATGYRSGTTAISDIYLLIEYEHSGIIYHAESGVLVPYKLYHAENGELVPYLLQHAEDGALVTYG